MYYCASEVCNMINGYVLTNDGNSDIYYTITESGAAAVETDSEATCTKENIGEVITTDGSTFKICLDDDEALTVAKGRYILGDGVGKGPFASNTKKMIEVDDGGAHIYVVNDLKAENGKNYIVKLATDNYKVYKYDEGNDQFEWDTSLYGVKTYLEETGSTVLSEYVVTDTQSIEADADVADWRLFNCKEGSCKATYGYIKSPNEVEKFIRIPDPDTSATDNVITTFSTDCGSADTYKLKADGTLCIDGDASAPKTGEMIEGNAFLVTTIDDNASIFNKAASNIIVQVSGNYIYYNNYYQEEGPNLFSDLVKIPTRRIVGEDSELLAKLALYDCGEDSCTASGGYAINSNGYYAITNDPGTTATVAYEIEEAKDCTDKVGEILTIGTSNYLCLDAAIQAELINGLYFLKTDTTANKPLKGYNTKIIRISDNFISVDHTLEASEDTKYIIKNGDSYTLYTYDSDGQTFAEGSGVTSVALYQPIAGTNVYQLIADEDAEKVTTNSEITDWMIFDCKTGDCHQTYGYYTVGSDDTLKYFSIPYSGANTILRVADITPKECKKAGDIGNLVKDGEDIKLCVVNNSDTPVLSAFEAKDYILSIENANIFIGASASKSMIIHGTATSFTRNINAPYAVNNIDPATKEVVAADYMDESAQAKVAILKCSVDGCEKVDGYTESSGSYYQISKTTGSSASLVPETTTCSETNVGKIIDISGTKTLCLSNSNGIDVTKKGIYVMGTVANGTPLVSGKMIEIADSYIVVDDGLEGTTDAVYLIKIGTDYLAYKYTATTKTFSKVTTVSGMKLYQALEAGSNVYQEVSTTEGLTLLDLTTLELFQCDSGKCVPLTGNISVKGKIYENSTDPTKWTVVTEEGTCSVGNVGKLKLKENTSAIQICMGTGETPSYALALLTAGTWYFIANKPYLMNSDLTILVNPAAVPGAYLVNNDNEVVTSSATKLVVCTDGTTCASKTFAEAGIGYYKDSADATKSIQCTGTACAIDTTSYAACASGKVGLLDNDGKLCVDTTPAHAAAFAEDSTPVYYVVSYEAASASTNIFKAQASKEGDYALIKATEISITLSTDAKTGTCYKNNEVSSGNEGTADACTSASGTFLACTSGVCTAPAPAPAAGSGGG
ncbi:hypothetical protein H8356DRAFT_1676606 [Neocallimastix lanati (nom. inval.)]|nr:hypothetical protein H8356DRAFT_1676606 [Neocallimastix sp. JGI-2020a]